MLATDRASYFVVLSFAAASVFGCNNSRSSPAADKPSREQSAIAKKESSSTGGIAMKFTLTSGAFKSGRPIPKRHTGEGDDVSPALDWEGAPNETKEFALICDDPDAPTPEPWVHWVIYGIPAEVRALPEGVKSNVAQLSQPVAARQGKNSWPSGVTIGYRGPMPPPGHGTHHYHFRLYALDTKLELASGATKQQLLDAMKGHVLADVELVGTYER
jgi:Raf kinase inhibitor-like YbhB/YbcL family protein